MPGLLRFLAVAAAVSLALQCAASSPGEVALRRRLAEDPGDHRVRLSLARALRLEQPGAALRHYEQVDRQERLDEPTDRRALAELLIERARKRLELGDPAAVSDVDRARALGGFVDVALERDALELAFVIGLRHSSADRRGLSSERHLPRLRKLAPSNPRWQVLEPERLALEALPELARWLELHGAKRLALTLLQRYADRGGNTRDAVDRWLLLHRWWFGQRQEPAPSALARAASTRTKCLASEHSRDCTQALLEDPRAAAEILPRVSTYAMRVDDEIAARNLASALSLAVARYEIVDADLERRMLEVSERVQGGAEGLAWSREAPSWLGAWTWLVRGQGTAQRWQEARGWSPVTPVPVALSTASFAVRWQVTDTQVQGVMDGYRRDPALADRLARELADSLALPAPRAAMLSALFAYLGDRQRSHQWALELLGSSPEHAPYLLWAAVTAASTGEVERARQLCWEAAAASGDPGHVFTVASRHAHLVGEALLAVEYAKEALQHTAPGEDLSLLWDLARAQDALGRHDDARAALEEAKLRLPHEQQEGFVERTRRAGSPHRRRALAQVDLVELAAAALQVDSLALWQNLEEVARAHGAEGLERAARTAVRARALEAVWLEWPAADAFTSAAELRR